MTKLVIPIAASLVLSIAPCLPAWADSSSTETHVEEHVEQQKVPVVESQHTTSSTVQTQGDDDERSAKSVTHEESVQTNGGMIQHRVEKKKVETEKQD